MRHDGRVPSLPKPAAKLMQDALAALVVGKQPTEDLPALAADALAEGADSPSLRVLAGAPKGEVRDSRDLFMFAVAELGFRVPTEPEAWRYLARNWAQDILSGRISAYERARRIWTEAANALGKPDDLVDFVGLASEWEDCPEQRTDFETEIVEAARRLLGDN